MGGVSKDKPGVTSGDVDEESTDRDLETDAVAGNGAVNTFEETISSIQRTLFEWTNGLIGDGTDREYDESELFEPDIEEQLRDHPTVTAVLDDVTTSFAEAENLVFDTRPPLAHLQSRFFDFSYLIEHEEIERKWTNEPYAYVSILRDTTENELRYHVTEPWLSDFEEYVLEELTKVLRNSLMYQETNGEMPKAERFSQEASDLVEKHTAALPETSLYKILYYLRRDFLNYDRVDPIIRDDAVEDISCDGVDLPVFVYHDSYRDLDTNVTFGKEDLISFVTRLAQRSGKHISVSNPLVDASLPNGSRVQLSFGGDISTRGPNFTIRQFTSVPDTPIDLINWDTFSVEQMAYLWLAIENNRSLLFAGGTGSGKTTSLNAVSFFIPKKSKIVTIEDTPEISLPHENWVQSLTRDSVTGSGRGQVTMYQQLQTALRQRPEYILVGEIRTESDVALTFFQAMATGHSAYTTVHAESVNGVINRLENEPLSVPLQMLKELDIISIQRQVMVEGERVRRNDQITELVSAGEGDDVHINRVFDWDADRDAFNTKFDSSVFDDIAADRGWSTAEINQEYEDRRKVLQYMVDNDITWYEDVARVIHRFMTDRETVMDRIDGDQLDPADLTK
ncbi:type II/IV secretion system ATPase subunit [Natronomonas halophila]|uniref:type II/IV secretion system ATPase subunit n=1 Tax=Natronomonas halophila TaxID=2747817 RepID=UPI0015B4468F|nr:type II/IV secretion system ATPase subunit [Natronomonas halophila]QLD86733.1 type II/IV secretion system ATPase subunit [Natronomonas halophila]